MIYGSYYHLTQEPFNLTPDPEFFYLGEKHQKALAHLLYGINHRKGFIALTGEVGAGKTTLCRLLLKQLDENVSIALILNSLIDEITLLKQINRDFGLFSESESKDELMGYLYDFLIAEKRKDRNVLIVVDECQNLKFEVLELIRMLSNLETEKDKLLQILLIGQPEFLDMLNSYELRQLNQRITVRGHISNLSLEEVGEYIQHRIQIAGNESGIPFAKGAYKLIHSFSGGVPRRINVVCDYALLAGYASGAREITRKIVEKAIQDVEVKRESPSDKAREQKKKRRTLFRLGEVAVLLMALYVFKDQVYVGMNDLWNSLSETYARSVEIEISRPNTVTRDSDASIQFTQGKKASLENFSTQVSTPDNIIETMNSNSLNQESNLASQDAKTEVTPDLSGLHMKLAPPLPPVSEFSSLSLPEDNTVEETTVDETDEFSDGPELEDVPEEPDQNEFIEHGSDDHESPPQILVKQETVADRYYQSLSPEEKSFWLLLSVWGIQVTHDRFDASGQKIPLKGVLDRFGFNYYSTWADLNILKVINLPIAVELEDESGKYFWVVDALADGKMKLLTGPEHWQVLEEDEFLRRWKGFAILLSEKGDFSLSPEKPIYKGQSGEEIVKLKRILSKLGYEIAAGDSLFDLNLESAVKLFQEEVGLLPDGIVGNEAKMIFYSLLNRYVPRLIVKKGD